MSREITHDGAGALQVRFPFDRDLVDRIKTLPHRRWNASERFWWVPDTDVVMLVDLLRDERFRIDEPTLELYLQYGGTTPPDVAPRAVRFPGLFDDPEVSGEGSAASDDDYTVSALNERVNDVIRSAFPSTIWLVGEISGFNKSAHRRHVSFELAERKDGGETVSKVPATLFEATRKTIEHELQQAGDPFRLEDEVTVRVRARVELYVPWGQYRVVVDGLDLQYTLGEAARRREEIVRRLAEAGLLERNSSLPLPPLPLRVALVTSLGSDAYNDVLRTFQESGFAFRIAAHGARVQGHSTEPSVLNALDWIRERAEEFDVALICRGGGSRTDLIWFDSERLGRAVADFPIPVVVGIGHEQDQSVLDAVGRSCKTPTAAAGFVVQIVEESLERLEVLSAELLLAAGKRIHDESRQGLERAGRLARAARGLLDAQRVQMIHGSERIVRGARNLVHAAEERLARWTFEIPRKASQRLETARSDLHHRLRAILQGTRRDLDTARRRIDDAVRVTGPRSARLLTHETERTGTRSRRLRLVDPRRVLERGYAILRLEGGTVLTDARRAAAGERVSAQLHRGRLRLVSEGPEVDLGDG